MMWYNIGFDLTPGGSGRQEGLACSGPWGHEESDTTKRLNNNKKIGFTTHDQLRAQLHYENELDDGSRLLKSD